MNKAPRARNLAFIEIMLSLGVFRRAMEYYLANSQSPTQNDVVSIMRGANLRIGGTTLGRRAQTVIGWVRWMMSLTASG